MHDPATYVYARDRAFQRWVAWSRDLDAGVYSELLLKNDKLYVGTDAGVPILSATTGKQLDECTDAMSERATIIANGWLYTAGGREICAIRLPE